MSKFCVRTFGCRCNQADSAAIREGLSRHSMAESETHLDAGLIVLNTCTVTHRTDQQVRQAVRRLHRENPAARIVVTGCYAERDPGALASIPGVDLVLGNADKERLAQIVAESQHEFENGSHGRIIHTAVEEAGDYLVRPMAQTGGKTRPIVKLQDGCDARCSYCIVPYVRGPGRSARPEHILAEIRSLIDRGFQEVVLTGVHLGSFGHRVEGHPRLADLLSQIFELPGLGRIRLSSIEPMRFDRAIVSLAAKQPSFAHHFHIPVQSGSDRILRLMKRPYKAARFLDLLQHIRSEIPDAGLGTDILTGFPGETDQDFEDTCKLVQNSPLTYLHVFPFSPREGTTAFSFPNRIPSKEMKRRLGILLEISRAKNLAFRRRFIGEILPAVTLSRAEDLGDSVVLTGNYIHARVPGLSVPPNCLVDIRIDDVQPESTSASLGNSYQSSVGSR
jgi:threonylcarbamoyladenosine tRNA methylthiotransferase MtaB